MKNSTWLPFAAALMLAASAAAAQTSMPLAAIFDNQKGLKGFTPESVVPVVREGKRAEAPRLPSIHASEPRVGASEPRVGASEAVPEVPQAAELVPIALEIAVPSGAPQIEAVSQGLGKLSAEYHFYPDASFEPVRLERIEIQPFPPITPKRQSYLVRGQAPAPRIEPLKRDAAVRKVYQDRSFDAKALNEVFLRYGRTIRREPGVVGVYVGFDCGMKGQHVHILPHHPAIVVEVEGSGSLKSVRASLFQNLPELALEPIVFVAK